MPFNLNQCCSATLSLVTVMYVRVNSLKLINTIVKHFLVVHLTVSQCFSFVLFTFSALTLLTRRDEGHLACTDFTSNL